DAAAFTQQELIEQIRKDSEQLAGDQVRTLDPGSRRQETTAGVFEPRPNAVIRREDFAKHEQGVWPGLYSILLENVTKHVDVDFVDLNPFSKKTWEIGVGKET